MFTIKALAAMLFVSAVSAQSYSCTCGVNHAQTKLACGRLPAGRMSGNEVFYRCLAPTIAARDEFLTRSCTLSQTECYEDNQKFSCLCGRTYAQTEGACEATGVGVMTGGRSDYSCIVPDANGRELFQTNACIIPGDTCVPIED